MAKLIILRGLPASGKSTWARSWCEDPANTWPHCVISLDDIRLMIAGSAQVRNRLQSEHGKRFNDMVVAMGRHMIADALDAGWDVVADAQHANPRYAAELALLAQRHGALWETRDFDVPLDELLRRNAARDTADRVPEDYIRSSWKHFHTAMFRPLEPGDPNGNLLERMRADPYVRVIPVRGETDVYACNFTAEAFREHRWTDRTINARGLFVGGNGQVVQRGFEKFFAVDETEETSFAQVVNHAQEHPESLSPRRTDFSGSWARRELLDCSASGRSRGKRIIPRLSSACFLQIQRYVPNCGVCCMSGMSRRRLKSSIASPTGTSLDTNHPGCACCI